jgi:L-fucose mutarotase
MLKGISPLISPSLLETLARMGHGDEIVLADAHFPGHSYNNNIIRADGLKIADLLDAILPLFDLDTYEGSPVIMMGVVKGDTADPVVEEDYLNAIKKSVPGLPGIEKISRYEFYERAEKAFAVVMTGETRKYGNIILRKGVTSVARQPSGPGLFAA